MILTTVLDVQSDVKKLQEEMKEVKADIVEMKEDIHELQKEMKEVKADIVEMKEDCLLYTSGINSNNQKNDYNGIVYYLN